MQELGVHCEFMIPPEGTAADQARMIESLIVRQIDGMAISPNDPDNQVDIINRAAEVMNVICQDSDAPDSNRLCYVGTDNYQAGREAGKLIKEALPDGGEIVIFVGRMDVENARERRQGVIDELAGAPMPEAGRTTAP
jgi:ribose transport system substrate-binding protein